MLKKKKKPPKVTKQICFSSWRLETVMGTWSQATESLPAAGLAQAGVHEASRVGPPQGLQASNRLEGGGTQVSLSPWRRPRVWRRCSPKPRACLPPEPRTGEPAGRLPLGVWGRVRGSGAQGEGASRRHGPPAHASALGTEGALHPGPQSLTVGDAGGPHQSSASHGSLAGPPPRRIW